MKVNELINILHKYSEKDVILKLDNWLYCSILDIRIEHGSVVIDGKTSILEKDKY